MIAFNWNWKIGKKSWKPRVALCSLSSCCDWNCIISVSSGQGCWGYAISSINKLVIGRSVKLWLVHQVLRNPPPAALTVLLLLMFTGRYDARANLLASGVYRWHICPKAILQVSMAGVHLNSDWFRPSSHHNINRFVVCVAGWTNVLLTRVGVE